MNTQKINRIFTIVFVTVSVLFLKPDLLKAQIDFKQDNVAYKNIYPKDLYRFLQSNPTAVLIDVRTAPEFADTAIRGYYDLGHLKGAINITSDSFPRAVTQLKKYSDVPVVLYCSHSQRSRRVGKMLADSGFVNVYNINGGMSYINRCDEDEMPDKDKLVVSQLPYTNISVSKMRELLKDKNTLILDVRTTAQFNSTDTAARENVGHIKKAVNIPLDELKDRLNEIKEYKDRNVIVYDGVGEKSNVAARLLSENGFKKVFHLQGGMDALVGTSKPTLELRRELVENAPPYTVLNAYEAIELIKSEKNLTIVDTSPVEIFENRSEKPWKRMGHLKNAVNIPHEQFKKVYAGVLKDKTAKIMVYGDESAKCSMTLIAAGYKNVVLMGTNLWELHWAPANIYGFNDTSPYIVE